MIQIEPICIDLFCGRFGWGLGFRDAGYLVIGVDNDPRSSKYADGMGFIEADIRDVPGQDFPPARAVVASPPCQELSTARNLSRRYNKRRDPETGMILVREAIRFIHENRPTYWCIENVHGGVAPISAELGPPRLRKHSYYLWGNFPGFLLPTSDRLRKFHSVETRADSHRYWGYKGVRSPALRALIPYALARSLADACLP